MREKLSSSWRRAYQLKAEQLLLDAQIRESQLCSKCVPSVR